MNNIVIGTVLIDNGNEWRVSAITETFYVATLNSIDSEVEPTQSSDIRIIKKCTI